ncbi:HNH endonuclease [Curtobacterium sp. NPDC092190]|uniref:HNH endonuclease n=1 Tax=Curtobacterium sp. NPDC092190 TaxID=3363973 RepID=UPI00381AFF3E
MLERDREQLAAAFRRRGKSSWRHTEIVRALQRDAENKCMYCESFIDDVSYGAVEHILPKSRFEHLALEWSNLGYCCPRCNTNKGAYWSEDDELRVLDPYTDEIESALMIVGPVVLPRS